MPTNVMWHTVAMGRMTADALDLKAARLEELAAEEEKLRAELCSQVETFGFTPPRAEKSKRLAGGFYQFTLTVGLTTEVKDAEVERIRAVCPEGKPGRRHHACASRRSRPNAPLL